MDPCYGQGSAIPSRLGTALSPPAVDTVASILADCMSATANIEGLLGRIDAKLFGEHPTAADCVKTAQEPPIESRCIGLRTRLREIVRYAETISDKL